MTDKELLELAAKAVGIEGRYVENQRLCFNGDWEEYSGIETELGYWNPLTDDGDALRLAVKLDITVSPRKTTWQFGRMAISHEYLNEEDAFAATRRAIVRAAVEIGKGMK